MRVFCEGFILPLLAIAVVNLYIVNPFNLPLAWRFFGVASSTVMAYAIAHALS
jgi:hypothetical protein